MTIASPSVISGAGHIYGAGVPIRFSTTGSLPTGFTAGTTYFVVNPVAGVSYQLALTIGGAAINTSGTQTGVHTAVGGIGVAGTLVSGSPSRSAANVQSRVNGMLVNTNAIPNGPGALAGLYLGTVRTNGAAATVSTAQAT